MAKKDCPVVSVNAVSVNACNIRHQTLDKNISEILNILKGNSDVPGDMGLMGDIRDIKRDKKWTYALLTIIGIPVLLMVIRYFI